MKKILLSLALLTLVAGGALAQAPVVNAGWSAFNIRAGGTGLPLIKDNDVYVTDSLEFVIYEGNQKAGLGTNLINGAKVSQITTVHVDRLDDPLLSGSLYGPYFNIWITDGAGNYAVIANEPSNGAWAADRWDVPNWDFLKTKICKVYETPNAGTATSWVHAYALTNGWSGVANELTFEHVAGLTISPPPPAYILDAANAVGGGAPDELGTNVAYGFNWIFGDTMANYVSGDEGFVVNGYSVTATLDVANITQGTSYATIEAALAAANPFDNITIADGTYNPPNTLNVNKALTITGASEAGVIINIPAAGGYGITPSASDITMSNFTLVANVANQNYPIHASGTTNPPNGYDNLTITNVTVNGAHRRAGVDIHGFNNVILADVTSMDATGGNGIQLTGVVGAAISGITTANNAWGSLSVYCSDVGYLNRGSSDVTIDGASCSFGEGTVFTEDQFGLLSTNIVVTGYGYNVRNFNFRVGAPAFTFFQDTEANAIAHALALDAIVPGSWITAIGGGTHIVAAGMGIQFAIDGAVSGDAISVAAGLYEEQLHITTDNLTISGAGVGSTVVGAPDNMPLFFTTSADNYPIVFVDGATGTTIDNLTVDGLGRGATNYKFCGLGLHNANGSYSDLSVTGLRNEPLNGNQHGVGLYVINDDAGTCTVNFTNVAVSDIQKNATVFDGAGLSVYADNLDCTGNGPLGLGLPAQNGIQVSGGAYAELTDCDIADYNYTEPAWTATGLLVFGPGSADMIGGTITACKTSVYAIDGSGSIDGTVVTDPASDPLYAYSTGAKSAMKIAPQPFGEIKPAIRSDKSALVFDIDNATFIGNDVVDSWGPTAYAAGPVEFNVTNTTIEHFDWGLVLYEDGGTVTGESHGNLLANNMSFGGWSNTVTPYDATMNDWGDLSGPFHPTLNLSGTGNEVSDNILFEPWTGMAQSTVVLSDAGPINCSETVSVTFNYLPDAASPDLFLFNAVIRPSAELAFGTITNNTIFNGTGNWYVIDNGDGSKTITNGTVATGGDPYEAANGLAPMFTIEFLPLSDGIGTIEVESLVLRDPTNATIPVNLPSASIEVDCTTPAAVTAITAAPGHNKVAVSWAHVGTDVANYLVYRGLWHDGTVGDSAYPEYDDVAPATPLARPASAVAANLDDEWELVDTVAVGTNSYLDVFTYSATSRGVYTYEVFAEDAAGNQSAAAPANDRATNYWLGDVAGPGGSIIPDGLVGVPDMNALGSNFGVVVPTGAPFNIIDVGPTDDWSRLGIPTTDSKINFEDLMIFSLNFGVVASAKDKAPVSKVVDLAWVAYDNGDMALRLVNGSGLKGLNVRADRPVGSVEAGQLLDDQSELTFLKNVGTNLDVSVAVMGQNQGFEGSGDLFIVRSDSGIEVADLHITARAIDNSELEFTMDTTSGTLTPRVFALNANYPNPFNPMTKISFSLPETQDVKLAVYSIDGRKIATLINETRGPGLHEIVWTGRNDNGQAVASGMYFYRIDAGPYSQVHKMTLMK